METIHKLEATMAGWYDKAPHLTKNGRDWIARNIWWIALVGVILGALGIVALAMTLLVGTALLGGTLGIIGLAAGAVATTATLISLVFTIAIVAIEAAAIRPLKARMKRGWELLFIAALVSAASLVVDLLFSGNLGGLIVGAIGLAIVGYVLFEIRTHFASVEPVAHQHLRQTK